MEDKNIGRVMGIFKIVEATTEREKYGHLLYVGECIYCGEKSKKKARRYEKCFNMYS